MYKFPFAKGLFDVIKEMIVVEGKEDTVAIKRAVEADTIETNGSAIGEDVLRRIALAQERRGVIIFTDPDHAGERIRKIVAQRVPGCKHAFYRRSWPPIKGISALRMRLLMQSGRRSRSCGQKRLQAWGPLLGMI